MYYMGLTDEDLHTTQPDGEIKHTSHCSLLRKYYFFAVKVCARPGRLPDNNKRDVIVLKKLVTGQFSLPVTFWGWGFCGGLFIGLIGMAGITTGYIAIVLLVFILKTVLFSAVLSGITFILRRKITVLGTLAFFIALIQVVMNLVMVIGFSSALLNN